MTTLSASAVFLPWEHRSLPLDKTQSVQSAIYTLKSLSALVSPALGTAYLLNHPDSRHAPLALQVVWDDPEDVHRLMFDGVCIAAHNNGYCGAYLADHIIAGNKAKAEARETLHYCRCNRTKQPSRLIVEPAWPNRRTTSPETHTLRAFLRTPSTARQHRMVATQTQKSPAPIKEPGFRFVGERIK